MFARAIGPFPLGARLGCTISVAVYSELLVLCGLWIRSCISIRLSCYESFLHTFVTNVRSDIGEHWLRIKGLGN